MQCTSPIFVYGKGCFPCGKCLACRIAKSREWSSRLLQELNYWEKAVFVTLTYNKENLPEDFGLHKDDLQKFFKRLRKRLPFPIKHFSCGEYGDEAIDPKTGLYKYPTHLGRPHYHCIIFGLGVDKASQEVIKDSWRFCDWYEFDVKKAFGSVTYDSCRYVSDYIFKKYDKVKAKEVYKGVQVPFKTCSLGLGERFCLDNAEQLISNMCFTVRGVPVSLPRYYVNKLGLELTPDNKDYEKWKNYARLKGWDIVTLSGKVFEHREQRNINLEKNAEVHKKGVL